MSSVKPIKLYSHAGGPNPWKVVVILNELGVPFEAEYPHALKDEPFISVNPNGRVPAIEDPNTGITLWESGSIIEYLLETYDRENKLSYTSFPEKYEQANWKYFQVSGQGPYFGQYFWFNNFHAEKIPSALDRYINEIKRVWSVIDAHLTKTGRPYLVGEKVSFADLMFVTWNNLVVIACGEAVLKELQEKSPKAWDWHQRLMGREAVKKSFEEMAKVRAAEGK